MPDEAKGNSNYTKSGWNNPLCPYKCDPGLT